MTHKEVRDRLKVVKSIDWFKSIEAQINLEHINVIIDFKGFAQLSQFVDRQLRGWEKIRIELPPEMQESRQCFKSISEELNSLLLQLSEGTEQSLQNRWNSKVLPFLQRLSNRKLFTCDSPFTSFLIEISKRGRSFYQGAFNILIVNNNVNFRNRDEFQGSVLAFEFLNQEDSIIVKRRNHEKSSISRLRNSFEAYFLKTEKHLNDHLRESDAKAEEYAKSLDNLVQKKREDFDSWFKENLDSFDSWFQKVDKDEKDFNTQSKERQKSLEKLYRDELMLEAPAKYWHKRAKNLKREGRQWLAGLLTTVIIAVVLLLITLSFISDGTLKEIFDKTGSAIRWSIVFIAMISFLAFAMRTFARMTFSSFHLVRDAEEREQLVYVYLALKHENSIEEEDRQLVLQSIFSRSDSGLLKEDSSPTMPGSVGLIEKAVKIK